jgi:hypothetical protein
MATRKVRTMLIPGKMPEITCTKRGSGSNAKEDDGRKTVHMKKKRKTSFQMDG